MTIRIEAGVSGVVGVPARFDHAFFRDVDLAEILVGMGPLPAVVSVENAAGRWDEPGLVRVLHLADGQSLRERMTGVDPPAGFAYEIDRITGPLGRLVTGMSGRWSFDAEGDAAAMARWHYVFHVRNAATWLPAWLIVRGFWQRYMGQVLARTARMAEASLADGARSVRSAAAQASPPE